MPRPATMAYNKVAVVFFARLSKWTGERQHLNMDQYSKDGMRELPVPKAVYCFDHSDCAFKNSTTES